MYSASTALLEALQRRGRHAYFRQFRQRPSRAGRGDRRGARARARRSRRIVTSPNEMVALSARMATRRSPGARRRCSCMSNAAPSRWRRRAQRRQGPGAGAHLRRRCRRSRRKASCSGSRNEFIQWIQDVLDQRGIVRGYMKYDNEIRTGKNVKQLVHRALQFAHSDPKGPVYLVGAREVMEEEVARRSPIDRARMARRSRRAALPPRRSRRIAAALAGAKRPLVVTSYLGRKPEAVGELVAPLPAARRRRARIRARRR